jgi:predicted Fe-S protein YdhL (DUF1289 family)
MPTPVSPCEKICTLDPRFGLCAGCGRSRNEIANWMKYSEAERARIMQELPGRLEFIALDRALPALPL